MTKSSFLTNLAKENKKLFIQFGGQGSQYMKELAKLYEETALKEFFQITFQIIKDEEKYIENKSFIAKGIDFKKWLDDPSSLPDEEYLFSAVISITGIFITQVANYLKMNELGFTSSELMKVSIGATGHSQGVVPAMLIALGKEGKEFYETYKKFLQYVIMLGYRAQEPYPNFQIDERLIQMSAELGEKVPSPMVAVIGYEKNELEDRVKQANSELNLPDDKKLYISLYNTPNSMIISSYPESLITFRKKYKPEMEERKGKFVYLRTTAPFHSPHVEKTAPKFEEDLKRIGFQFKGEELKFPVYSYFDGRNFQTEQDIGRAVYKEILCKPLYWDKSIQILCKNKNLVGLDYGPSSTSQKLTQAHLQSAGSENEVFCASITKDLKVLLGEQKTAE